MKIIQSPDELRQARSSLEGRVALVPTMGYLHEGHLSLMREAHEHADHLIASIFVNPTQFGPGEDYEDYPRDTEGDLQKCREEGCDIAFTPTTSQIYNKEHRTTVSVAGLTDQLCGAQRPGHFDGVCTIVSKLFHICQPDVGVFGEKDYQQLVVLRKMTSDLNMPVEIVGAPIVREPDGLAVSSRNEYLDQDQREDATCLSEALEVGWQMYRKGGKAPDIVEAIRQRLLETVSPQQIDYAECVHPTTLAPLDKSDISVDELDEVVAAVAVEIGEARLIDNLHLDRPLPPELKN